MNPQTEALRQRLLTQLRAATNRDGGWPYFAGKSSRVEPTAWVLLATAGDAAWKEFAWRAIDRLRAWQLPSGLMAEPGLPPSPAFNAVALLALLAWGEEKALNGSAAARVAAALGKVRGIPVKKNPLQRQDNSIPGWPWKEGNFSWVEPTCWSLLALKAARARRLSVDSERITDAERLLADRVCKGGGWNYGNSNVLGQQLQAYVPTTAAALLSVPERREEAFVKQSLEYLQSDWKSEPTGFPLALTLLCFRRYGFPSAEVESALFEADRRSAFLENVATVAMVAAALRTDTDALAPFRF